MNHYEVLGVPTGADPAEIRRAYRHLARKHHPDFHVDANAATQATNRRRMQEVNEAWAVLGDRDRRAQYDRLVQEGRADVSGTTTVGRSGTATPTGKGWTPRADDTAWMSDFDRWREEDDRLPPDPPGRRRSNPLAVVPFALFVLAVALGSISMALMSRPLLAGAFIALASSAILFVLLPVREMLRHRGEG